VETPLVEQIIMKFTVELCVFIAIVVAVLRPKWLVYFLIFSLLEPSRNLSLGNYVILGTVNIKFYELTLVFIYFGAVFNRRRDVFACLNGGMCIFVGLALLSLVRGLLDGYGQAAFNQFRTLFALGMTIAMPLLFKSPRELRPVLRFFLLMVVVTGTIELLDVLEYNPLADWIRRGPRFSDIPDATILSATQGAILAMPFLYLASTMRSLGTQLLPGMMAAFWCGGLSVLSASRGVWLGLIGSTAGLIWLLDFRKKITVILTIALVGVFAWVFIRSFYIPRYDMRIEERLSSMVDMQEGNARWRLNAWRQMVDDIRHYPFIGWPFGTQPTFIVYYGDMHVEQHAPHNEYLKIARYTGLIGFGAFLWFIVGIFTSGIRFMLRHRNQDCYYEVLGLLLCFLFHAITAVFTQAFTTMDRSPIVWAIPGFIMLYILAERENGRARAHVPGKPA
jgi:hypothetical protein